MRSSQPVFFLVRVARRRELLAGESDVEGAAVWRQITAAIEELQRERRTGDAVN